MTRRKRKARNEHGPGGAAAATAATDSEPPLGSSEPPPSDPAALRGRNAIEEATTARLDLGDQPERDHAQSASSNPPAAAPAAAPPAAPRPKSDPPPPPPPRKSLPGPVPADLPPVPRATDASAKKTSSIAPDAIGRTLDGRYLIEERLGVGGVGAVYLGTQLALGRSVAIKLLHEGLDPSFRTRFEREAKALAALRHPNIVSVTDYGLDGTTPYLVMEKLEGETLGERLARGPLLPEHVLELARQLLRALGFVHEQGLVHRDLKPGNLFLELTPDGDERLKLLDFGLAKFVQEPGVEGQTVTRAGHVVGTPAYMAPEQIAGDAVDARSDIYAVGVLLYQALSGRVPFEGEPMEQLKGHLVAPVPPLTNAQAGQQPRPELNALIMRALEKRRDARFGSALEMLVAIEAVPQPWLIDSGPGDDDADGDAGAVAKTVVHQAAAKRHAVAQQQARPWRARARLAFLLTLGAMALIGVQQLRTRLPRIVPKPIAPQVVPGERSAQSAETAGSGTDMVFGFPEAAREPTAVPAAGEAEAGQGGEPIAVVAPGEAVAGEAAPATDDGQPLAAEQAEAAPEAAATPTQPSQPAGWRNPWLRDTPTALRQIRKAVMDGSSGNDRMIVTLRKYNRTAEHDARGHLLLARMYLNRGWRDDALNQFATAVQVDPSSRGAPKMLSDLLGIVANGKDSREAARFVRETYGSEALREIDHALLVYKADSSALIRLKSLRTTIAGP